MTIDCKNLLKTLSQDVRKNSNNEALTNILKKD